MRKCYHEQDRFRMCCSKSSPETQIFVLAINISNTKFPSKLNKFSGIRTPKQTHFTASSISVLELHWQESRVIHAATLFPKFRFCSSNILLFWKKFVIYYRV